LESPRPWHPARRRSRSSRSVPTAQDSLRLEVVWLGFEMRFPDDASLAFASRIAAGVVEANPTALS